LDRAWDGGWQLVAGGWCYGREILGDFLLGAAGQDAVGVVLDVPAGFGFRVFLFDDQPLVALAAVFHFDQHKLAAKLFAVQPELQIAAFNLGVGGRVAQQLINAAIPQHHAAAAILAFWNIALEVAVVERVIFHVYGQILRERLQAGTLWHGP
jgi:hypothetical protein